MKYYFLFIVAFYVHLHNAFAAQESANSVANLATSQILQKSTPMNEIPYFLADDNNCIWHLKIDYRPKMKRVMYKGHQVCGNANNLKLMLAGAMTLTACEQTNDVYATIFGARDPQTEAPKNENNYSAEEKVTAGKNKAACDLIKDNVDPEFKSIEQIELYMKEHQIYLQ